jgi:hypothetical protein
MIIGSGVTIGSNITIGDLPVVIYTPQTALYTFTTFTFQTANIVGPTGPTAAQLFGNTYSNVGNTWLTNTSYFNATSTGYQYWTVPQDGNYQIVAAGARAGITTYTANLTSANLYGRGATISGTFALSQGQILAIAVGQPSANTTSSSYTSAGGGGGTFVVLGNTFPLVVAGGGGGVGFYNTIPLFGANAATAANGVSSYNGAPGGVLGQGGNTHINAAGTVSNNLYDSGAGGGFSGNGAGGGSNTTRPGTVAASTSYGQGGLGFAYGLIGGSYSTTYAPPVTSSGGFGGGGGAGPITGGGGGGYSGGGGAYASSQPIVDSGGAGGSWVAANATAIATHTGTFNGSSTFNGLTVTTVGTLNAGAGYVTITKV